MTWQQRYLDRFYRQRPNWLSGTEQFHNLIASNLPENATALELGAGPGNRTSKLLSELSSCVDGLDIDPQVKSNEFLNQAFVYEGETFPLRDASYDAVVADYVLEHVEKPRAVLSEIARVLRPGGVFLFRTPNLFHYVSLISRATPHVIHRLSRQFVHGEVDEAEAYPTFYRLNSARRIRRLCRDVGLDATDLELIEKEPSYLQFCRPAFLVGVAYERFVNSSNLLRSLRVNILGAIRNSPMQEYEAQTECQLQRPTRDAA